MFHLTPKNDCLYYNIAPLQVQAFTTLKLWGDGRVTPLNKTEQPCLTVKKIQSQLSTKTVTSMQQTHGNTVYLITKENANTQPFCDALMTNTQQCALLIQHADCQPIILYDRKKKALGAIHCGWRGTVQNIIGSTIDKMKKEFHTNPKDLIALIGPSLGPDQAEFIHYKKEIPQNLWTHKNSKHFFNFWNISKEQLIDCGVPDLDIFTAKMCTASNPDLFFSYRKEKSLYRHITVAMLR